MTQIILVRHGEAEHNVSNLTGGWTDSKLTPKGWRQVRALSRRLKTELTAEYRVISSDLRRAVQTAEVICEELGSKLEFSESLREFNNGIAANRYREEVQEYFTEATEPYLDWQPWPEGETWRTFYNRVSRFMDSIDLEKPLIIVCHAGTIQMIVVWWLMTPPEYFGRIAFHTHTSSITVLGETEFKDRLIERLNDTIHLSLNGMGYNLPRPGKERED